LAGGMAGGGSVAALAFVVARYGPSGGDWSFRGNGALAVYALIPAFLVGGWTAISLRYRHRSWVPGGLAAGAIGAALAAIDAILLPAFGAAADQAAGPIVLVLLCGWTAFAPVLALWLPGTSPAAERSAAGSIATALLWAAGLVTGLIGVGFIVPAGS
jgi:hypothetical protein